MNDIAFQITVEAERTIGGLMYVDLGVLNGKINRNPLKPICYDYSIDVLQAKLAQLDA
jgi:hypothetical protein